MKNLFEYLISKANKNKIITNMNDLFDKCLEILKKGLGRIGALYGDEDTGDLYIIVRVEPKKAYKFYNYLSKTKVDKSGVVFINIDENGNSVNSLYIERLIISISKAGLEPIKEFNEYAKILK